jgi:hypothetical protein
MLLGAFSFVIFLSESPYNSSFFESMLSEIEDAASEGDE